MGQTQELVLVGLARKLGSGQAMQELGLEQTEAAVWLGVVWE